jgi:hypothetical protein
MAVELDEGVLAEAREQAALEGMPLERFLEQLVRRHLAAASVQEKARAALATLRELQERGPHLDEDEGLRLASEELRAMRAERRAGG